MKSIGCIIARTNSTRLPKKVLRTVSGRKLIECIIDKMKRVKKLDEIYICTSIDPDDQILLDIATENGVKGYAGSRDSVLDRMLDVGKKENADCLVRITGDNIFTDEVYLDIMLEKHQQYDAEYTRTENLPVGVTSEIINLTALKHCKTIIAPEYSQYLMLYMFNPSLYKCLTIIPPKEHQHPDWSLTVDSPEDMKRTLDILQNQAFIPDYDQICKICKNTNPDHLQYNQSGDVKFPAGVIISFEAYRAEMDHRIKNAHQEKISLEMYQEVYREQQV